MRLRPALLIASLSWPLVFGCHRAPKESPEYQQAFTLYNALYARSLDDAYGDPQMQHVADLLGEVDPKSEPAPEAQALLTKVTQGMADYRARAKRVADDQKAANQPAKFDGQGSPDLAPRPAAQGPATGPALGMSRDAFNARFGDCFERKGDYEQGEKRGEAFAVLANCADRYPAFADSIVVLIDNKVASLVPTKELAVRTVDAGLLPAPPATTSAAPSAAGPAGAGSAHLSGRAAPRLAGGGAPRLAAGSARHSFALSALDLRGRLMMGALKRTPRHALTRAVGRLAGLTAPAPLARFAVRAFARRYDLDLREASEPIGSYESVRGIFTRALKPGLRPIAPGERIAVSPADGRVSANGVSAGGELLQVKGIHYALGALLADAELTQAVQGGAYATVYLSPHDYHRVHAPLGGTLNAVTYVPGDLWPVNAASVQSVPGLFTVNERLVFDFATPAGRCAVVMVGATVVGKLRATIGAGTAEPFTSRPGRIERRAFADVRVAKGEQIGIFDMGSTVVACFAPGVVRLRTFAEGEAVRVGESLLGGAA